MLWKTNPYYYHILEHILWNNMNTDDCCPTRQLDGTPFSYARNKLNLIGMMIEEIENYYKVQRKGMKCLYTDTICDAADYAGCTYCKW